MSVSSSVSSASNTEANQRIQRWLAQFTDARCVIVIPVFNAYNDVSRCIEALIADHACDVPILILDDGSTDPRIGQLDAQVAHDRRFLIVHKSGNEGFVAAANLAFTACKPLDVVLLNSDVITPPNWLPRLRAAAHCRSNTATATPLTNNGTIVSVPHRNEPSAFPSDPTLERIAEADAKVARASSKLRPSMPTSIGHCTYYRRTALDAVGLYDPAFSPGYEEEVDWAQRAVRAGFCHVLADDVFVYHNGARSFDAHHAIQVNALREEHRRLIAQRYPWYLPWVTETQNDCSSPFARALAEASAALLGRKIAIDLTFVDGGTTGYQVVALELADALARSATKVSERHEVYLIAPDRLPLADLKGADRAATVVRLSAALAQRQPAYDLIFRPFQTHTNTDVSRLQQLGRRCVMHLLDLIMYSNPSYAVSFAAWNAYRRQLEQALATMDGVTFNSYDAVLATAHAGCAPPDERTLMIYLGVGHALHSDQPSDNFRQGALADQPFILMLGANYHHKNRLYALRALRALFEQHDWSGKLVFAGPHAPLGDSSADEKAEIESSQRLRGRVVDLGAVNEAEKRWLLERARLVLYPSICEGFGLVPFEAALAGTPAIAMRMTSLPEVLGEDVIYLESLDPQAGVETIWALLTDDDLRQRQVAALVRRAAHFQWDRTADALWPFFDHILRLPKRAPHPLAELAGATSARAKATPTMEKLANDARRRLRGWSRTSRTYGYKAMLVEIWDYIRWRLRQLG